MSYRDPDSSDLDSPLFKAIWDIIKTWDINVPSQYEGYSGSTGNHVMMILDNLEIEIKNMLRCSDEELAEKLCSSSRMERECAEILYSQRQKYENR